MFKNLRILILLMVLLVVALGSYRDRNQDWQAPIYVALYPVNGDGSVAAGEYIKYLSAQDFDAIGAYMNAQGQIYGKNVRMYYRLGSEVNAPPPSVPQDGSVLSAILWSLKFRYYAYRNSPSIGSVTPNLRLYLQYYDPKHQRLGHTSTALENGRIGVVHLFASTDKRANNNVVIAHETLHAFGASDKYDLRTGQPIYPVGYAKPDANPRYPQHYAELMAMHKPLSPSEHRMAKQLSETIIGQASAIEIGWLK